MTAHTRRLPKLALPLGVAVFVGLFILGQWREIWLPFWIVGTVGSGAFVVWLAVPALRRPQRLWEERCVRGVLETAVYVAIAAYTFWISLGHLTEELAHLSPVCHRKGRQS